MEEVLLKRGSVVRTVIHNVFITKIFIVYIILSLLTIYLNLNYMLYGSNYDQAEHAFTPQRVMMHIVSIGHLLCAFIFFLNHVLVQSWLDVQTVKKNQKIQDQVPLSQILKRLFLYLERIGSFGFAYKFLILISSVAGQFFQASFVLSLIIFIVEFSLLRSIIRAVMIHINQIVATIFFAWIMMYWFSVYSYDFETVREPLYTFGALLSTESFYAYFRGHINEGWTNSPGFTGVTNGDMTAFNLLYVLIINMLTQAIICGIIIDTFAALRAKNERLREDNNTRCFICNMSRTTFERLKIDYRQHKMEHHMDKYTWVRFYLEKKNDLEKSGLEMRLWEQVQEHGIRYFPVQQSLAVIRRGGENKRNTDVSAQHQDN